MDNNELIQEISKLMDAKLKPIKDKIEDIDIRLDSIQLELKMLQRDNRRDHNRLYDGIDTLVEVLENKGILPKVE